MTTTHGFVLVVEGLDLDDDDAIDAVYEAGCDDCVVGFQNGRTTMSFDREHATLEGAVASAVAQLAPLGIRTVAVEDHDGTPLDIATTGTA